jgi:hypothetical protein
MLFPTSAWREFGKPRKIFGAAYIHAEIRTSDFHNAKQGSYILDYIVRSLISVYSPNIVIYTGASIYDAPNVP